MKIARSETGKTIYLFRGETSAAMIHTNGGLGHTLGSHRMWRRALRHRTAGSCWVEYRIQVLHNYPTSGLRESPPELVTGGFRRSERSLQYQCGDTNYRAMEVRLPTMLCSQFVSRLQQRL